MALRGWTGILNVEGEQTGDGRLIVAGATEWGDGPWPLGWLQQEQHGDLLAGAVQIGTIDAISRSGANIMGSGSIDDANPAGAELIRRLDAGTASAGNRVGLSIDPDNWSVEIVDTTGEMADMLMMVASGSGSLPARRARGVQAAAGDPDPGDTGVVLFTDEAGAILERYVRLRIRGVTACAVPAFAGAYLELEAPDAGAAAPTTAPTTAPTVVASAPARPPAAWFSIPEPQPGDEGMVDVYGMPAQELLIEQPLDRFGLGGGLGVPVTITDDGRVFGHTALWGQCHVGYPDECVTAPPSMAAYEHFHHGEVHCAEGGRIATGVLTASCDHAAARLLAPEARDHYAHSGLGFADVRATNGTLGVWVSGALRPGITDDQLRVLRASSLSGDWRRVGADLEFIAALAVNVPGFPISREHVTASGMRVVQASLVASAHYEDGRVMSLVGSGVVQRCPECAQRQRAQIEGSLLSAEPDPRLDEALTLLRRLDLRTRHLTAAAKDHALTRFTPIHPDDIHPAVASAWTDGQVRRPRR